MNCAQEFCVDKANKPGVTVTLSTNIFFQEREFLHKPHFATLFLFNAKEHYQLTQSSLNFITQQIQQMISFTIDEIAEVAHKCFSEQMQGASEIPFTVQLESFRNPFLHVQTEYMQNKYYHEHFNLVVSILLFLNPLTLPVLL